MKNVKYEYQVVDSHYGVIYTAISREEARYVKREEKVMRPGCDVKIIQHKYSLQETKQIR